MDLIKKGKIPNEFWYGKCQVCNSIFKSTDKELDKIADIQGGDYRSDYEYFYLTHCDFCKAPRLSVIFYSKDSRSGLKIYKETIWPQTLIFRFEW